MTPALPTPPSARDIALTAYREAFNAARGSRDEKHVTAYEVVFFGKPDPWDLFDFVYDEMEIGT